MNSGKLPLEALTSESENIRSPDYKRVYVNTSKMSLSAWDIRMTFGQSMETPDGTTTQNEELVTIMMSPQHAKAVLKGFADTVEAYEQHFGEIKLLTNVANVIPEGVSVKKKK